MSGQGKQSASPDEVRRLKNYRPPGGSPDTVDEQTGMTPLMAATLRGDCATVLALLEAGASIFAAVPASGKGFALHRATRPFGVRGWEPAATVTPFELAIEAGQIEIATMMLTCCRGRDQTWRDGRLRALVDTAIVRCQWDIAERIFDATSACGLRLRGKTINARYATVLASRQWPLADRFLKRAFTMSLSTQQVQLLARQTVREGNEQLVRPLLQRLRPDKRQCSELFEEALARPNWHTLDVLLDTLDPDDDEHHALLHRALYQAVDAGQNGLSRRIIDFAAIEVKSLWRGRNSLYARLVAGGNARGLAVLVQIRTLSGQALFERLLKHEKPALAQSVQEVLGLLIAPARFDAGPARSDRRSEKMFNAVLHGLQRVSCTHADQRRIAIAALMMLGLRGAVAETVVHRYLYLGQALANAATSRNGLNGRQARFAFAALLAGVGMQPDSQTGEHDSNALEAGQPSPIKMGLDEQNDQQFMLLRSVGRDVVARALAPLASALKGGGLGSLANASDGVRRSIERALVEDAAVPQAVAAILVDTWLRLAPATHRLDYLRVPRDRSRHELEALARSAPAVLKAARRTACVELLPFATAALPQLRAVHAFVPGVHGALQPWYRYSLQALAQVCEAIIGQEAIAPNRQASPGQ